MVGTDASQQMLSEAMLKKEIALYGENFEREEPSDPGIAKLLFLCQPMQELDMYGTLDAAVCALDSLNHVTDPQVVQRIFDRVSLFLNPGAVFVFDVNSVYKHREVLGNNVFVFDREDVYCVWQNSGSGRGAGADGPGFLCLSRGRRHLYPHQRELLRSAPYTDGEIRQFIEKSGLKLVAALCGGQL